MKWDEISGCPYPFGYYLKELTDDIIVFFGKKGKVLDYNKRLLDLSGLERGNITERTVEELFISAEGELSDLPEEGSHVELKLQLSSLFFDHEDYFFTGYVFNTGENYCLIGEERQEGERETLEKISLLNNALSNKTRELTKKNRALEKANRRIEELSRTDTLTGLANRRHFVDYFEKTISQARRHSQPLSLIMIDLDRFKEVNDTYGHTAGDDLLSAIGDLLNQQTRKEDLAARIGGEEFAVLLTQAGTEEALEYAERLRKEVMELDIEPVPEEVTASLGISTMKSDDDIESMMKRADEALYRSKEAGRNRVCRA